MFYYVKLIQDDSEIAIYMSDCEYVNMQHS